MKKLKSWLSVWFGFMMNVLVNPGVMMKQGFKAAAVDAGFFQVVKERELEKLAEENKKKRRAEKQFQQSLMMLYEKATREARAGPLLPLQKR
ncbi:MULTISPECIES: hypothetical protein [Bacillus]|uniref:Uncharacterized protein n=1 Tax=Bacillus zhangzhouensis TaxID=1178540 RepID=A0A081LAL8_9BACI|nr:MULTISPECIES: hypothetical protein [Bacillus]KEP26294.1 hypothetical protein BA70_03285 [Bacillus zhangzhouensis]MDR0124003.1 hypothetical protein [Bacillus zhangzhouensis]PRO42255.1 hypothetical protein C6W18_09025 [Bacillus sp. LLTC93]